MPPARVIELNSATNAFEAVVPVVKIALDGAISLIGTAFVISSSGLVITAKHVILDNLDSHWRDTGGIGVMPIFGRFAGIYRSFRHSSWNEVADIALCECAQFSNQNDGVAIKNSLALTLSLVNQRAGEPVSSQFFHDPGLRPNMEIAEENQNPLRQWKSNFEVKLRSIGSETPKTDDILRIFSASARITHGKLTNYFSDGRDRVMLPFPVFESNMPIYAGASGGPVFNSEGHVIAVNCTRIEGAGISYHTDIGNALDLFVPNTETSNDLEPKDRTLRELASLGIVSIHGFQP